MTPCPYACAFLKKARSHIGCTSVLTMAGNESERGDGGDEEPHWGARSPSGLSGMAATLTAAVAIGEWERDLRSMRRSVPPVHRVPAK